MTKTIRYNRDTKDFDMYLDGEYVGSRATHGEAEPALDAIASAQLADAAAAETDLSVPAAAEILAVVKDRHDAARQAEDFAGARQLDRVRANVARGARLTWSYGDLLIQSVNTPGAVYSVNRSGCTCPNGAAGKAACWHLQLHDLLLEMRDDAAATADMAAELAALLPDADDADPGDDGAGSEPHPLAGLTVGAYVRTQLLESMLARSAAQIAALGQAVAAQPTPAALGQRLARARQACYRVAA